MSSCRPRKSSRFTLVDMAELHQYPTELVAGAFLLGQRLGELGLRDDLVLHQQITESDLLAGPGCLVHRPSPSGWFIACSRCRANRSRARVVAVGGTGIGLARTGGIVDGFQ
jgi:hypothetical protein